MKRLLTIIIWLPAVVITIFFSFLTYEYYSQCLLEEKEITALFTPFKSFLPAVLGISVDNQTEITAKYLKKYRSPMEKSASALVKSAKTYNIDPFLLVAIAQCESNLGKKTADNCFNPFGLGIYADKKLCFISWEESFEYMARILRQKYFNYGLTTPEQIMVKYCPASIENADGSWAKCVNRFMKEAGNTSL